jgi:hypothetical protein
VDEDVVFADGVAVEAGDLEVVDLLTDGFGGNCLDGELSSVAEEKNVSSEKVPGVDPAAFDRRIVRDASVVFQCGTLGEILTANHPVRMPERGLDGFPADGHEHGIAVVVTLEGLQNFAQSPLAADQIQGPDLFADFDGFNGLVAGFGQDDRAGRKAQLLDDFPGVDEFVSVFGPGFQGFSGEFSSGDALAEAGGHGETGGSGFDELAAAQVDAHVHGVREDSHARSHARDVQAGLDAVQRFGPGVFGRDRARVDARLVEHR